VVQQIDASRPESRPQTDSTLSLSQNLFEALLGTYGVATIAMSIDGQITFANDQAAKVLDLPQSLLPHRINDTAEQKITDVEANNLKSKLPFAQVMQTGEPVINLQQAIADNDKQERYFWVSGFPFKDSSGKVTHIVFSLTERAEPPPTPAADHETIKFQHTFQPSLTAQLWIDADTLAIVDATPTVATFYGYPVNVLRQMQWTDITPLSSQSIQANIQQLRVYGQQQQLWPHRLASGEVCQIEVCLNWLEIAGRKLICSAITNLVSLQEHGLALKLGVQQEQFIENIARAIRQSSDLKTILQVSVNQVRQLLAADRVIIYRHTGLGETGSVIVESCVAGYPTLLGWKLGNINIEEKQFAEPFQHPKNQAIADITQCNLDAAYVQLLETFEVKAQLTLPIYDGDQVWGLLIAQQCCANREWLQPDILLLQQLENQLVIAIRQAALSQQVQQLQADLKNEIQERTSQVKQILSSEAVLRHITEKIHKSLDEKSVLQTAVQELSLVLSLNSCHASLYNPELQTATVRHEYICSGSSLKGTTIHINDHPDIYQPLLRGECLQVCLRAPKHNHYSQSSILYCPIADDAQGILGDLMLITTKHHVFKQQELQLVQQVAQQCAIAIRQSRLYQSAQAQIRELEKLNQIREDFLSTTSHELRTPLSSIKTATQLMGTLLRQSNEVLNPKLERCLNILQEECDREINLINDLLLLQQLNAGTHPFVVSTVNLQEWIPQTVEKIKSTFNKYQLSYQVDISSEIRPIKTDLFMLNRVLEELLRNASKFTPPGETVSVIAKCIKNTDQHTCDQIQIQVINTGIEISADEIPNIFKQFYRIPSNDPWKHGGTGLGLALVKKLVSLLGGTIQVTSGELTTCFRVDLPLNSELS